MCLGWLLGSPRSRGLCQRAISMSGGVELTYSRDQAARVAAHVASRLGMAPTAAAMRGVGITRVLDVQEAIAPGEIDLSVGGEPDRTAGLLWPVPVRDGDVVAEDSLAAIGSGARVDLLAGDTEQEGWLYLAGVPGFDRLPREAVEALAARLSEDPAALLAACEAREPAGGGPLAAALMTEVAFHGPTVRLLDAHAGLRAGTTYAYRFRWRSSALGARLGAAHTVDLPFVFETLEVPGMAGTDDALLGCEGGCQELASRMHAAWVRFVTDGDPGWEPYPALERF